MSKERRETPRPLRFEISGHGNSLHFKLPKVIDPEISGLVDDRLNEGPRTSNTGIFMDLRSGDITPFEIDTYQHSKERIIRPSAAILITSKTNDPDGGMLHDQLVGLGDLLTADNQVFIFEERLRTSKGTSVVQALKRTNIKRVEIYYVAYFNLFVGVSLRPQPETYDVRAHPDVPRGQKAARIRAREAGFDFDAVSWDELLERLSETDNPWEDLSLARMGRGSMWVEKCGCDWRIDLKGREGVVDPCKDHRQGWENLRYKE